MVPQVESENVGGVLGILGGFVKIQGGLRRFHGTQAGLRDSFRAFQSLNEFHGRLRWLQVVSYVFQRRSWGLNCVSGSFPNT